MLWPLDTLLSGIIVTLPLGVWQLIEAAPITIRVITPYCPNTSRLLLTCNRAERGSQT